jgi:23S rRNA (cytosine1962-C5)-methyltransferase
METPAAATTPPLVLFEDEHLLVVNKPAGLNTHAPSPFAGEGIHEWLKNREPRWAKLAIIHRLDKDTSGVMVFGKTPVANRGLTEQFATRKVRKTYVLLTPKSPAQDSFKVSTTMVRVGDRYLSKPGAVSGDKAETSFQVLQPDDPKRADLIGSIPAGSKEAQHFAIIAQPFTGRTHQIRVHASESGFPILGDTLYGGASANRLMLHAASLFFRHPATGAELEFHVPAEFGKDARLSLRESLIDPTQSDSFRILHGASDGEPGWYVDKLGPYLLSQAEAPASQEQEAELARLATTLNCKGTYHKLLNRRVRQANVQESSATLISGESAPEKFMIRENGLSFETSFVEGYSTGLFLDQRENRRRLLTGHVGPEFSLQAQADDAFKVLNTFAYTCGFSMAAAQAGAHTTSLDLSKKYLEWGKRNFEHNGLDPAQHDFIFGDVFDWVARFAKKQRTFDLVILDPPTFSQSRESGVFQAERDYSRLVALACKVVRKEGYLFASTNAAEWKPEDFVASVEQGLREAGRKAGRKQFVPQPPDFPGSRSEPPYLKTLWLQLD